MSAVRTIREVIDFPVEKKSGKKSIAELELLLAQEPLSLALFLASKPVDRYIEEAQPPREIVRFILGLFEWAEEEVELWEGEIPLAISSFKVAEYTGKKPGAVRIALKRLKDVGVLKAKDVGCQETRKATIYVKGEKFDEYSNH